MNIEHIYRLIRVIWFSHQIGLGFENNSFRHNWNDSSMYKENLYKRSPEHSL